MAVMAVMAVVVAVGAVTDLLLHCTDYIVRVASYGCPRADGLVQMASCGLHCVVALWDCDCIVYPGLRSSQ